MRSRYRDCSSSTTRARLSASCMGGIPSPGSPTTRPAVLRFFDRTTLLCETKQITPKRRYRKEGGQKKKLSSTKTGDPGPRVSRFVEGEASDPSDWDPNISCGRTNTSGETRMLCPVGGQRPSILCKSGQRGRAAPELSLPDDPESRIPSPMSLFISLDAPK